MLGCVDESDRLAVLGQHAAARALQQGVEPDHQTFVLLGLYRDPAGFAFGMQAAGVGDHLIPGRRRGRHQIGPVPQQLGVGRHRRGIQLALPSGCRERPGQCVRGGIGLRSTRRVIGQRQCPTRFGELRGPHDVQCHQVEGSIVAGDPAGELKPLVVGALGQAELLNPEPATEFVVASVGHGGERRGLAGRGVKADDAFVASRTARRRGGDDQNCQAGGGYPPGANANDRHHHRLPSSAR